MDSNHLARDLDALAARYRPIVGFKVRRALGGANPDWEDVTNEVLAQVIAKLRAGEFRGESSIGTFIYTITCRRIVDYIRDKTKVLRHAPEPAPLPDPAERAERKDRLARLTEALARLKPKYRDVLHLYYVRDLSREETARALGLTVAQVSERANYGCKILRRILGPSFFSISGRPGRLNNGMGKAGPR
jgi:RNA polymerase sigma-70 factor (ECF subfamily)